MKPTINQIAKKSGVSVSTVSRVLNGESGVSESTKKQVLKVVEELNYVPLRRRRRPFSKKKTGVIALVVTDISNPFFPEVVHGVEDLAFSLGYSVSLWNTRENLEREKQYVENLKTSEVDGIILGSSRLQENQIEEIVENDIPCVVVNRIIRGAASVFVDYREGAYRATKYLLHLGHERIALINGPANAQPSLWREQGFWEAMREAGKKPEKDLVSFNPPVVEGGYVATLKLLSAANPPTAIFAYNDLVALGAMKAVREKNLVIPRDISIIGYDDSFFCPYLDPPLSTVGQPKYMMGKLAGDLLFRLINGGEIINKEISLKPELVIRASCGVRI